MKFCIITCIILTIGINCVSAKISHLLVSSIGNGVFQLGDNNRSEQISTSSFLPKQKKLFVRPQSGIETLASGYLFRFGSSTSFECQKNSIKIFSGSIFLRSRKFQNSISISVPKTSLKLSGAGSCLIEVNLDGGIKCVGLLGSLRLTVQNEKPISIRPGELLIIQSSDHALEQKVTVDLQNLFRTSFLISGFPNSSSFEDALKSVAQSQKLVIKQPPADPADNALDPEKTEILLPPVSASSPSALTSTIGPQSLHPGYVLPRESPLQELLGRSPKRVASSPPPRDNFVDANTSENLPSTRPFPSRLLRGN